MRRMTSQTFRMSVATLCVVALGAQAALGDELKSVEIDIGEVDLSQAVEEASTRGETVLDHIGTARAAIEDGALDYAERELSQAQLQLTELKRLNPAAGFQEVLDEASAKLGREGAGAALLVLQPVYENLTVTDDYEDALAHIEVRTTHPVVGRRSHHHTKRALERLQQEDVEEAEVELHKAYHTAVYTEVDLPILATYWQVPHALQALEDGFPLVADRQLRAAEASARIVVTVAKSESIQIDVAAEPD